MSQDDSTGGFLEYQPNNEDLFRGIILFGRNVASYKFALGKSILELAANGKEEISLSELAVPFSEHICEHLLIEDRQTTSASSTFLGECRKFNQGKISVEKLYETTVSKGLDVVIKHFHRLGPEDIPRRFFIDERKSRVKV